MKKLTPFILFMLLLATGGLHRAEAQLYVNLHGGLTLPQGDYADSRMSDHEWMLAQGHQHKGGAGRGWAAGLEVSYAGTCRTTTNRCVCCTTASAAFTR